jgi:hypothetical protein
MSGLPLERRPGGGEQQGEFRCEALSLHQETAMNTIRLPRVEPDLARGGIVAAVKDAPAFPAQAAANSTLFSALSADRPWIASSRRERQASAAAALIACAATLGAVVALFASLG